MKDLVVTFSGGRSSAFMSKWLLDNMSHVFKFHFVFANTGQEHEKTLEFVNRCDLEFGLSLVWLEAVVDPEKGKVTKYKIVSYETADRKGTPFEDVIKKYGISNKEYPHCTRELKLRPVDQWEIDNNLNHASRALGIRSDEPKRIKRKDKVFYPLVDLISITKPEILKWWRSQPFDLNLPEHLGNCTWCWKKSLRKLRTVAKDYPQYFEFPLWMEVKYRHIITNEAVGLERVFFRERRSTVDILEMSLQPFEEFVDLDYEECAEECGSILPDL